MTDIVNFKDLANGYYPHLRKLAADDPEWVDILAWFSSKGIPAYTQFATPRGIDPVKNLVVALPTEIHWNKPGAETLKLDAALVFNFPHVALVELKNYFSVGNPAAIEMYPGLRKPIVELPQNPIGAPWPEKGPNAFRPSDSDQRNPLPYYSEVSVGGDRFIKERHGWVFVTYPIWVRQS